MDIIKTVAIIEITNKNDRLQIPRVIKRNPK